jgi:error-prone DNA polymerase
MTDFIHLHVASSYSLRYGTATPGALADRASRAGMPALALTDRDGLYGAFKHVEACLAAGIQPILGADLALDEAAPPPGAAAPTSAAAPRITALAVGKRGWASLCRLVSAAHAHGGAARAAGASAPSITPEIVAEHASDLVILLGADSDVARAIAARRPDKAAAALRAWRDRAEVVIEITDHLQSGSTIRAIRMAGLAREHNVPAVLTNAVRHLDPADSQVAEVLDAARNLVPLGSPKLTKLNGRAHLATPGQMLAVAQRITDDPDELLKTTLALAERCMLDPRADLGIGDKHLPELAAADPHAQLTQRCETAVTSESPASQKRRDRMSRELAIIKNTGMASYFLTVADVADRIRAKGIRCAIRGSGAGSLVNHLLGISAIDPLEHGLIMERFLSEGRATLPDIDLDVESARRIESYLIIMDAYGTERTACVSMMETYRARSAIRDVATAMGLPPTEIDAIAKAFPHIRAKHIGNALTELPELRSSQLGIPQLTMVFRLAEKLDGLPRHVAMHPCGVLLSNNTLLDRTAVERSVLDGLPLSQLDKDDAEIAGVIKLDVLGVRMQSAMAYTLQEIARTRSVSVDLDKIQRDDTPTYEMIQRADTLGCFQIESPGQRELVTKLAPRDIGDLIVDISLFRPGPVNSDMISPYLLTRHGKTLPTFPHPDLRDALAETGGVVVFHEQVLRILDAMTGCGLSEADQIRRKLSDPIGLDSTERWFRATALRNGYEAATVDRVWEVLAAFGGFGFCKAHAAAFAIPTYQSAWLKRHYPAAFYAGVLTHDPGMYPKRVIVADAKRAAVPVLPVDVNRSVDGWRVSITGGGDSPGHPTSPEGIRVSLREVKGISDAEVANIMASQPYRSLRDFWNRAQVSRPVTERLVLAGAFDSLYAAEAASRRDLLARVNVLARASSRTPRNPLTLDLFSGDLFSGTLFPDDGAEASDGFADLVPAGQLRDLDPAERVAAELDILGFDVSQHVLSFYEDLLGELRVVRSGDLRGCRPGDTVLVAGVKVATQTPAVRSGQRIIFATLDDARGLVDLAFFESVQDRCAARVFGSWLLLVRGKIRRAGAGPLATTVNATDCWDLPSLEEIRVADGMPAVRAAMSAGDQPGQQPRRPAAAGVVFSNGFALSPYAETGGPGAPVKSAPRNLWHASPGSAGNTYPAVPA